MVSQLGYHDVRSVNVVPLVLSFRWHHCFHCVLVVPQEQNMSRLLKPYTGKWLLLVCALTFFLLPSLSDAFGVSSSHALKLSQGEGMGRCRPVFLVAETTELVANAAAMSDVAGDPFWQRIALAFVETGGAAGGVATILAVLLC